jgi:hypothetical protein
MEGQGRDRVEKIIVLNSQTAKNQTLDTNTPLILISATPQSD